uniref:Trafficking protein particle complex subunit 6B n=1 Tax=Phakopsora pachyrhizi TaxID=170000 RepID=A0A0S1MIX1_PHAPC
MDYFMNEMISSVTESATNSIRKSVNDRNDHQENHRPRAIEGSTNDSSRLVEVDVNEVEVEEAYRIRMDSAGYRVGWVLAERISKDKNRFPRTLSNTPTSVPDQLEAIKFICKDLWTALYSKQADNLRTNHRGIYVIQDHNYRPFIRLSTSLGYEAEMDNLCKKMLTFPLGVIRGALMNLGVQSIVSAEITVPQCTFQIRTANASTSTPTPIK